MFTLLKSSILLRKKKKSNVDLVADMNFSHDRPFQNNGCNLFRQIARQIFICFSPSVFTPLSFCVAHILTNKNKKKIDKSKRPKKKQLKDWNGQNWIICHIFCTYSSFDSCILVSLPKTICTKDHNSNK